MEPVINIKHPCPTCGRNHDGTANSFNACEPVMYEEISEEEENHGKTQD